MQSSTAWQALASGHLGLSSIAFRPWKVLASLMVAMLLSPLASHALINWSVKDGSFACDWDQTGPRQRKNGVTRVLWSTLKNSD